MSEVVTAVAAVLPFVLNATTFFCIKYPVDNQPLRAPLIEEPLSGTRASLSQRVSHTDRMGVSYF